MHFYQTVISIFYAYYAKNWKKKFKTLQELTFMLNTF